MKSPWAIIGLALFVASAAALAGNPYTGTALIGERLLVRTANGKSFIPPLDDGHVVGEQRQVGFSDARISPDGSIVGWLALYPNCCTSYPIPLELVLAKDGSVFQRIRGNGLPIHRWRFSNDGQSVAFFQSPMHGDHPSHFELRDIGTGTLLEKADPDSGFDPVSLPEWARGLE